MIVLREVLESEFRFLEGKLKTQLEVVFPDIDAERLDKIKNSVKDYIWNSYRNIDSNVNIDCEVDDSGCSDHFKRRLEKNG